MKPLLKICGLTRPEDLLDAIAAGADYVGVVAVADSPRYVNAPAIRNLFRLVPRGTARRVVVTARLSCAEAMELVDFTGADIIQLHGAEPAGYARQLRGVEVWRAFHLRGEADIEEAAEFPCSMIVADSARGGSGQCCDWEAVSRLARLRRVLLAGGITPDNAAAALAATGAAGVDVASGVETSPGLKSSDKIFQLARRINS